MAKIIQGEQYAIEVILTDDEENVITPSEIEEV